jgi:hypothetical protein
MSTPIASPTATLRANSWVLTVLGCFYYLLAYRVIVIQLPISANMFEGLGVDLPLLTRGLFSNCYWLVPMLFLGSAVLLLARKAVKFSKLQLRLVNWFLIVVGVGIPLCVAFLLYLPLLILTYRLHAR